MPLWGTGSKTDTGFTGAEPGIDSGLKIRRRLTKDACLKIAEKPTTSFYSGPGSVKLLGVRKPQGSL